MHVALLAPEPEQLKPKLEKLRSRAKALGLVWEWRQVDGVTRIQRHQPCRWDDDGVPVAFRLEGVDCARIELDAVPRMSGYTFVARIEHTAAGNLVSRIGDIEVPKRYWDADPVCEHCRLSRLRADTFLLADDAGQLIQVGRTCLGDFLRSADPTLLLRDFIQVFRAFDPDAEGYGGGWATATPEFVAAALASIELCGYRKSTETSSTSLHAAWLTAPEPSGKERATWRAQQPTSDQRQRALAMVSWARELTKGYDYEQNLKVAASLPFVKRHHMGLLASLPVTYAKTKARELAQQLSPDPPDAGYYAAKGARVEVTVLVLRIVEIASDFGLRLLYVMRTEAGHDLTWFCTGKPFFLAGATVKAGQTITLRGTVKRHELYRGRHQTTLNRCTLLSTEGSSP